MDVLSTNITITITALVAFFVGVILCYLVFFSRSTGAEVLSTFKTGRASIDASADFMPAIVLLVVTICFTGGLAYIVDKQIYSNDKEKSKEGIKNAIGVSWGLFVFAAVLIPFALDYARISADSKYYLMASLFTFYFATLAAIIIFFDRLHTLPEKKDELDLSTTYNTLLGLFVLLVGYGAYGVLIM
jgi:preprotein translocase subunit SecG